MVRQDTNRLNRISMRKLVIFDNGLGVSATHPWGSYVQKERECLSMLTLLITTLNYLNMMVGLITLEIELKS